VIAWLGMHNYTYLSLRHGGHFSVKEVAKSFADIFVRGTGTRRLAPAGPLGFAGARHPVTA
jgi:hypothetical protein